MSTAEVLAGVDIVALRLGGEGALELLLIRRAQAPFAEQWALPGVLVNGRCADASLDAAAARALQDKARIAPAHLEQVATVGNAVRDPRGWSVAIAYCALLPVQNLPPNRSDISVVPLSALPQLPFDHRAILDAALERVRSKSLYSSLPVHLCGETFTLPQLQKVYENILGEPLNKVSFRRKMDEMDWLEAVPGAMLGGGAHRPAQLYRAKPGFSQTLALTARGL